MRFKKKFDMASHVRGAFGDFGNIKCLYHIEPVGNISDGVRNTIKIFTYFT